MTLLLQSDFPLLARELDGIPISYLDSAATSLKPEKVLEAERYYAFTYTSNIHRGHNALAEEVSYHYELARRKIAGWIKADPDLTIMLPNTTFAIASVAYGLGLTKQDTILCASNNHHSNLLPWMARAKVVHLENDPLASIDPDIVISAIKKYRPKLFAFSWVSNVNGVISPAAELCKIAKEYGVISLIDAAQAAPHFEINVSELDCDFLAFSGHKMLGPTGTGVLYGRRELLEKLEPMVIGGGTVDRVSGNEYTLKQLPYKFEAGTPNISGVIGLGAAIQYLEKIEHKNIVAHDQMLKNVMIDVFQNIKKIKVLVSPDKSNSIALVSVVPNMNIHSDTLCRILSDSYKIMTRSGFHCAHPLFDKLNISKGAVRFSGYLYNTVEEIFAAGVALEKIVR